MLKKEVSTSCLHPVVIKQMIGVVGALGVYIGISGEV